MLQWISRNTPPDFKDGNKFLMWTWCFDYFNFIRTHSQTSSDYIDTGDCFLWLINAFQPPGLDLVSLYIFKDNELGTKGSRWNKSEIALMQQIKAL